MKEAFHGLPEKTVAHLHEVFADHPQVDKAILYGSRAMGNYKKGSDIDLTLHGERLTYKALMKIAGEIDDLPIPYTVDLSIFDLLDHAKLKDHIERVGKTFYQKEKVEWKTVNLGDVCSFVRGLTYSKKDEVRHSGNAVLRATNINLTTHSLVLDEIRYISDNVNISKDKLAKTGDILICTASGSKSHLGKVALIAKDMEMAFGGFMGAIRTKNNCLPEFLFKVLISESFKKHLANISDGTNINNLKFSQIDSYELLLPPMEEQRRIVARLDAAFAQIDKAISASKRKQNEIEQLKKSALKSEIEGNKNLSSTWKTVKLGDVCNIVRGGSPRPISKYLTNSPKGINWIKIGDANISSKYIERTSAKITEAGISRSRFVKEGDLLLSNSMSFGRPYIMKISGCVHDGWLVLSGYHQKINSEYLYYSLASRSTSCQFESAARGSTVRNLNIDLVSKVTISYPPMKEQKRIVKKLDAIFEQADIASDTVKKQLALYESLKSAILTSELGNKT